MLVEGPRGRTGAFVPALFVCARDAWGTHADVVDAARRATRWVHPVTAGGFGWRSRVDSRSVRCGLRRRQTRELPEPSVGETLVVLAQGRDPGNVGTTSSHVDAFGAVGVITVSGTVEATSLKVVRASAGSAFHISCASFPSSEEAHALIHLCRSCTAGEFSGGVGSL